jgi:hypothetical protein
MYSIFHSPALTPRLLRRAALMSATAGVILTAGLAAGASPAGAAGFSASAQLPRLGGGRIWQVAAQPGSPSTILAGTDRGIYASHDAGATWGTTSYSGKRVWAVGFDARNPALAFAGSAGQGVLSSTDGGQTWQASSTGLLNRDVRSLAFGLEGIAAGTAAGVFLSPDGQAWHDVGLDGDSIAAVAIAANSPTTTIIAGADSGQLGSGYMFRSAGGGSWQPLLSGLPSGAVVSRISAGPIDQAVPQRPLMAATTKGLFRSGDGGTTWTASTGVPSTLSVTTTTFSPLDPTLVYAGSDAGGSSGGDLLRSTDGGVTFTPADQGLPQTTKNVESITVGQTNPPTVVAALDPPSGGGLVYTEVDTTAPAPPQLVAESPGAAIPTVISTPHPTPRATATPSHNAPPPPPATGFAAFVGTVFHWPIPLIYELIFALLVAYLFVRWRQHYYVAGPP